jgi:hypothetical protein
VETGSEFLLAMMKKKKRKKKKKKKKKKKIIMMNCLKVIWLYFVQGKSC